MVTKDKPTKPKQQQLNKVEPLKHLDIKRKRKLQLVPIIQRNARAFVALHHRHNKAPRGDIFRVAIETADKELIGVIMVGRPVARMLDDGYTVEILRTCIKAGHYPNACSMLIGAACRAARALSFKKIITYTLSTESGTTYKACGFVKDSTVNGAEWNRPSRQREQLGLFQTMNKTRWIKVFKNHK